MHCALVFVPGPSAGGARGAADALSAESLLRRRPRRAEVLIKRQQRGAEAPVRLHAARATEGGKSSHRTVKSLPGGPARSMQHRVHAS